MATAKPHIAVIRFSAMGDVAMTLPVLIALQKTYPVQLTLVSRSVFAPLVEDTSIDFFSVDLKGKHNGFFGLVKLYFDLRKQQITAVADCHQVIRSKVLRAFFALGGIPVAVINKGREEKRALTRIANKIFKPLVHTTERYADVFEKLGYPVQLQAFSPIQKAINKKASALAGQKTQKWIGIAPFAQHQSKVYPPNLMKHVIELLLEKPCKLFLFGGGAAEINQLNQWAAGLENIVVVAGKLTFSEELSLIAQLDLMLSMDSANGHLAANFAVPVITLWGATHPYAGFAPFGQPLENMLMPDREKYPGLPTSVYGNKIVQGYQEVMASILPEDVARLVWEKAN